MSKGGGTMAKGNRCYLCGGKLRRGRCTECGLDNYRMTRRNYRLNVTTPHHVKQQQVAASKAEVKKYEQVYENKQQSMENWGKPMSEKRKTVVQKPVNTPTKSNTGPTVYQQQMENRKKKTENSRKKPWIGPLIGLLCIIFPLLSEMGGCVTNLIDDLSYGTPEYAFTEVEEVGIDAVFPEGAVSEDEYEWVTRELASEGAVYSEIYGPGHYIVGVHIPEGTYQVQMLEGSYVYSYLEDYENSIFLNMNLGEDAYDAVTSLENVHMYNGACLEVSGDGTLLFSTENAQLDSMSGMENPMDSSAIASFYAGTDETVDVVVGEDIPAGVYDFVAVSGWASVLVSYPVEIPGEGMEPYFYEYYYWVDSETNEITYKNIVLIDGMTVSFTDCELQFVPSEWIRDTEYEALFNEKYLY